MTATEERLAAVEAEIAQIKSELRSSRPGVIGRTNPKLIAELWGHSANDPQAELVWRAIEAEREAEREAAQRGGAEHILWTT